MYQRIDEKIAVVGVYQPASRLKFEPKKFLWLHKTYLVEAITLVNDVKDGGVRKRLYSLVSGGNIYRVCFNRDSEIWQLEEIWYDG